MSNPIYFYEIIGLSLVTFRLASILKEKHMELLGIGMPGGVEIFVIIFLLVGIILPLAAIIDIATSQFKDGTTKLIWLLVVIFAPFLGTLIYFAVGKGQKKPKRTFNLNSED
ncbi:PLD nuclease N-terminal domain-containing protein [Roseivirga thermotolerans]|uniref:Cardiolipin synthase N-terminal domain-containing protein n=2 Tax=Roseivirgaceae TaxID=2762306 RepID=A0ABQ3I8Z3_9BACT|nr:PLD nuclease N-terminal domain-containing protein [Roseivirga thermotolerans]GHE72383.1 hypothetical protein GCM10011340_30860 [Roseivirga thermotolerans]